MNLFKLKIITPHNIFFDDDVMQIIVRTTEGDVGILAKHENYVANIPSGILKITMKNSEIKYAAVTDGFLKVSYDRDTTIVTNAAEWGEDIDLVWANRSKEDALNKIKTAQNDSDMARAELKLKRAINRINVSSIMK